tara:strand:+ start:2284 stop:3438 length:1155 start_codon:yes stop_codon:yes gene_type:complete
MFLKLLKIGFIFLFSKKILKPPKKKKVLIIGDTEKYLNIFLGKDYELFSKNDFELIHVWGEKINLYIVLKCLINLKFKFTDYCNEYIQEVKPKILLSVLDNYKFIYDLKKNKYQKKILIQNAYRFGDTIDFKINTKKYNVDHVFVFSKSVADKYFNLLKCNVHVIGSFFMNHLITKIRKKKNSKIYPYLYISVFRKLNQSKFSLNKKKKFTEAEKELVKNIYEYTSKKKKKLFILGTNKNTFKDEFDYYNNIFQNKKNWKLLKPKKRSYKYAYEQIFKSKLVLGLDSTLLYESFAAGIKTIFFDYRTKSNRSFGWPNKFKNTGNFWTNKRSKKVLKNLIDKVSNTSKKNWQRIFMKYKDELISIDANNNKFKEIFKLSLKIKST